MPVLEETERQSATRSALRYRPIHAKSSGPRPIVARQRRSRPDVLTTTASVRPDELDQGEEKYPPITARTVVPRKSVPVATSRHQFHPLFFLGLGLLAIILLWMGITQLLAWGNNE